MRRRDILKSAASVDNARAGRKLGCGIEDPANHKRKHEVAAAIAIRAEDTIEADLAGGAKSRGDVTVWQGSYHGEGVALGRDDRAAPEHSTDVSDRPV